MANKLKAEHEAFLARIKSLGGKVLPLTCPDCGESHEVPAPIDANDIWDTLSRCPECGTDFFKIVTAEKAVGQSIKHIVGGLH